MTAGLLIYLTYALLRARAVLKEVNDHDRHRLDSDSCSIAPSSPPSSFLSARYMTRVFNGERTFLSPVLRPVEAVLYWIGGVDETARAALDHLYCRDAVLPRRAAS